MAVDVNRKAAPRQPIVRIDRTGPWGRVMYEHVLACGHTEIRKRAAKAPVMACSGCVIAADHEAEITALKDGGGTTGTVEEFVDYDQEQVDLDLVAGRLTARIAALLGVGSDDVDIRMELDLAGRLSITGVTVHTDPDTVHRLAAT